MSTIFSIKTEKKMTNLETTSTMFDVKETSTLIKIYKKFHPPKQGSLTEGEGSVQLISF